MVTPGDPLCSVEVSVEASAPPGTTLDGVLTSRTSAGDLSEPLTAHVVDGPPAPDTTTLAAPAGGSVRAGSSVDAVTGADGSAEVTITASADAAYEWSYAGDDASSPTLAPATSDPAATDVVPVVSARVERASVPRGRPDRAYGSVRPAGTGARVLLQRRRRGAWQTVASSTIRRQTLPGAHQARTGFVLDVPTATRGALSLRVLLPATTRLESSTSAGLRVHVT